MGKIMWQITNNLDWEHLSQSFSWIRDMEGVKQDPIFHAEGDVSVHTRMVLEALQSLASFQELDEQAQHVLVAAALLHDVEKRTCTLIKEDGRVSSPRHAQKGEYTARQLLYQDVPAPFAIREEVAKLVRYHGLPLLIFEKPSPQRYLLQASLEVNTKLLSILAAADVLGRICPDQEELHYRIQCFNEYAQEQACFGVAYPFSSALSRFTYFQQMEGSPMYEPFDNTWSEVVLMAGLPGMGKDSYIQQHLSSWPVISLDNLRRKHKVTHRDPKGNGRLIQLALEEARSYLRRQESFVWNATNLTRSTRKKLIDLFTSYRAKVRIVYIEVPFQQWQQQNLEREYAVPAKVVMKMLKRLDIPSIAEAHQVDYVIKE